MPEVKDELGNKVGEFEYTPKGEAAADKIVAQNPGYTVTNAGERSQTMYAGGGKTGYDVPQYKEGGKTKKKSKKKSKPRNPLFNPDVRHIVEEIAQRNKKYDEGERARGPYVKGTKLTWDDVHGEFGYDKRAKQILKKK